MNKKLFIVVNHDWFFLSHRKELAVAAKEKGWDVTIVASNTGLFDEINGLGLRTIDLPINATGMNLRQEWKTFFFLYKLYRKNKPDVVHHVGLKVILWGGLAAKIIGINGVVNAVSGLGVLFSSDKTSFVTRCILSVIRYSHNRNRICDIFQNHEDEELFLARRVTRPENAVYIKGSGIDLKTFPLTPVPKQGPIVIMFSGRMVREKGVVVLIEAAEKLRKEYEGKVQFLLCGKLSDNPTALKQEELESLCDGEYIKWLGYRNDIKDLLGLCHIVAFPSYYREGVPKSLIEATAIGRPIVTCNSIGCKDTVQDGENGYLVPVKDSNALAEKLKVLIDNPDLRRRMGEKSRIIAERDFSISNVINKHMETYAWVCNA